MGSAWAQIFRINWKGNYSSYVPSISTQRAALFHHIPICMYSAFSEYFASNKLRSHLLTSMRHAICDFNYIIRRFARVPRVV